MTLGERIKQLRKERGLSRPKLAERARMKYPTLAGIENGDQESTTHIAELAAALGVSAQWLATGLGKPHEVKESAGTYAEWADVRGFAQAVGLGHGPEAQEYADTHTLKFKASSLARQKLNPEKLAVMYGAGDSMEPRIHSGDAVLFDTSDTRPVDGGLYVILAPGAGADEYGVKRCEILDDMVFFKADNPAGDHSWRKPRRMDNRRFPIQIVGRVRWIGSWEH